MSENIIPVSRVRAAAVQAAKKVDPIYYVLAGRIERALANEGFKENTDDLSLANAAEHFAEILSPLSRNDVKENW